jgi:hypothetical protein
MPLKLDGAPMKNKSNFIKLNKIDEDNKPDVFFAGGLSR